jgi:putative ABC transport system permease protein
MDSLIQDIRYAVRSLLARPAFTVVAAMTLALGIGANSAIFSVVNAVLLKPLPYREPDRIVQFWETNPLKGWTQASVAPANFFDWEQQSSSFEEMAAYMGSDTKDAGLADLQLTGSGEPERVKTLFVTGNIFSVLGVQPLLGRTLVAEETWETKQRVVILSYSLWQRRFGGDPEIVGKKISLNGREYEVVGVMSSEFYFPASNVELWTPTNWPKSDILPLRRPHFLRAVARLKPGVSVDEAQAELSTIAARLEQQYPDTNTQMGASIGPLHEWIVGDTRTALLIFLAAVGLVLLIACANVANLMLVRGASRSREIAVRAAVGASRLRIVRQLLIESCVLALAGGSAGLLLASFGQDVLLEFNPGNIPRLDQVSLDGRVLGFSVATTLFTAILFGLLPALQSSKLDLISSLKEGGQKGSVSGGGTSRNVLVVAEVALSFVLVIGAGLMLKSFVRLQRVEPGFQPDHLLMMRLSLPGIRYGDGAKSISFYEQLQDRLVNLRGVKATGAASTLPLKGYRWSCDFTIEGRPAEEYGKEVRNNEITPEYFEAAGIPLVAGRHFARSDNGSNPVVIINDALARRHFPNNDAVGQRLKLERPWEEGTWYSIIGVVKSNKQDNLRVEPVPEIYQPLRQYPQSQMSIVVRTEADPSSMIAAVRSEIHGLDSALAVYDIQTGNELVYKSLERDRFAMLLLGIFAGVAMLLAAVGIYGVMSYTASQRTHEMGVRIALGARPRDIVSLIVGGGLKLATVGVAAGVLGAYGLTRLISSLLHNVSPTDPATFALVAAGLIVVAFAACYLPARKSSRVDPLVALKYE